MLDELLSTLIAQFRERTRSETKSGNTGLEAYCRAALSLGRGADSVAAKCWVGLFAESLRHPPLLARVRRYITSEVTTIIALSDQKLKKADASAIVSFILGALVFGAFSPETAKGFAAPKLEQLMHSLMEAA